MRVRVRVRVRVRACACVKHASGCASLPSAVAVM